MTDWLQGEWKRRLAEAKLVKVQCRDCGARYTSSDNPRPSTCATCGSKRLRLLPA